MTEAANRLLNEALQLSEADRAHLAAKLLASLDSAEADFQKAWAREIERRADEARSSEVGEEDWRAVMERVEQEVLRR